MDMQDNLLERLVAILSESAARRNQARLKGRRPTKASMRTAADQTKRIKDNGLAAA